MSVDPRRIKDLFIAAVDLPDPAARQAFLDRECGADPDLRHRLNVLLFAHDHPESALERPLAAASDPATQAFIPESSTTDVARETAQAVGTIVASRYKLLEIIGEGGMGEVWVADQLTPIRRRVALKMIKPGMDSRSILARFEAERQALAIMDHPNIAKVLDAGATDDGRPFFVMELVKGVPITTFCDARKLSPRERLELFIPVCQAIQHAHQKGIIHRDIKPSNVLVALHDEQPIPKVIDFGVAKAVGQQLTEKTIYTGFGALVGTPAYMAPEQATFNQLDVDTRADVYALGVILYELLAGSPPFEPEQLKKAALDEILRLVREVEPPRPSTRLSTSQAKATIAAVRQSDPVRLAKLVRGELDWIVMKSLEKDRNRRYDTANALAVDVARYLKDERVEACPPTLGYRLRKAYRKNRAAMRAAFAFLCLVLGAGVLATLLAIQARRAEMLALVQREEAEFARQMAAEQRMAAELNAQQTKVAESEAKVVLNFLASTIIQGQFDEIFHGRPNGDTTLRAALLGAEKEIPHAFRDQPTAEATVRYMIGTRLLVFEETEAAVRNLERAYALRKARLGPAHEDTISTAFSLAIGLSGMNQHDRAVQLLEETRALRLTHPPGPRGAAVTLDTMTESLADVYENAGRFDDAVRLWQSVVESHPKPEEDRAMALRSLGHILVVASRPREAETVLRESLAIFETHQDSDWIRFDVMSELGESLLQQKRYPEAEPLLLSAYKELKAREGHDLGKGPLVGDDHLPEVATRLARLYEATGRRTLAAEWRAKGRPERAPRPREVKR